MPADASEHGQGSLNGRPVGAEKRQLLGTMGILYPSRKDGKELPRPRAYGGLCRAVTALSGPFQHRLLDIGLRLGNQPSFVDQPPNVAPKVVPPGSSRVPAFRGLVVAGASAADRPSCGINGAARKCNRSSQLAQVCRSRSEQYGTARDPNPVPYRVHSKSPPSKLPEWPTFAPPAKKCLGFPFRKPGP